MTNRIPLLTGLLVVQLLLVGIVLLRGGEEQTAGALLDFDASEVSSLTIEDGEGNRVELLSTDGSWRVNGVPADSNKITGVIDSLTSGSAGWPVATSESSQARFEVTADAFQRRVRFAGASGELAVLYIGTSPGFRRVHARTEGDDAVFSINFGIHELPVDGDDWLNKQLFRTEEISSVVFPGGQTLTMDGEGTWTLDGQPVDATATDEYVGRIARLSVLGFADPSTREGLGEPQAVSVEDGQGRHTLSFRFDEAEDEYVLTSDRIEGAFTVASYIAEQILVPADELKAGASETDATEADASEATVTETDEEA